MAWGQLGWLVWLAGLPLAPFLLPKTLDLYHAQMTWFHAGLGVMGACALTSQRLGVPNKPLACWMGWGALLSLWWWTQTLLQQKAFAFPLLMGFGHLMTLGLFFALYTQTWTPQTLPTLLRGLAVTGAVLTVYGVLQLWNLDQFFNDTSQGRDIVHGTLGNPNHFGCYLALMLPLFLLQPERWWRYLAAIALLLIICTQSVGAYAATGASLLYGLGVWKPKWVLPALAVGAIALWVALLLVPRFTNPEGRWEAWGTFGRMFLAKPLTGWGPGFIHAWSQTVTEGPMFQWRHAHNEYLQVAVEQGLLGLSILGWMLASTAQKAWRLRHDPVGLACGMLVVALAVNSLVNFPAHLVVISSLGLVAVSSLWILDAAL